MPIIWGSNKKISLDIKHSLRNGVCVIIVFPAPTTVIVAKQLFTKYLSHERRNILGTQKHSAHASLR